MAEKRKKRPRDPLALAKMIGDIATGQVAERQEQESPNVTRARKAGLKGGRARAAALTASERKAIAAKAAASRWKRKKPEPTS